MDGSDNSRFLTVEEVASMLRKKERTIREWCYSKTIPHYKVGSSLLFKLEEISKWTEEECKIELRSEQVLMRVEGDSKKSKSERPILITESKRENL